MQLTLGVAPGGDAAARALAGVQERLAQAGWQCVRPDPCSETQLRRALPGCTVLHLVADATSVGGSYVTLRLADSAGGTRSLNVQAFAALLKQAAPTLPLLVMQPATAEPAAVAAHALALRALRDAGIASLVSMAAPNAAGVLLVCSDLPAVNDAPVGRMPTTVPPRL